jgi:TPR repeat protein
MSKAHSNFAAFALLLFGTLCFAASPATPIPGRLQGTPYERVNPNQVGLQNTLPSLSTPETAELKTLYDNCQKGSPSTCTDLGKFHEAHGDKRGAEPYFAKACVLDDGMGCYNLAAHYEDARQEKPAKNLFVRSCQVGYVPGCEKIRSLEGGAAGRSIASCEENSQCSQANAPSKAESRMKSEEDGALEKLTHSCRARVASACFHVARHYEIDGDVNMAHVYYDRSCHLQYSLACRELASHPN